MVPNPGRFDGAQATLFCCGMCKVKFPEKEFIDHYPHCRSYFLVEQDLIASENPPHKKDQDQWMKRPYRVIRGDFSQNRFGGLPCTALAAAMAAAFISYSTSRSIGSFTNIDINEILDYGYNLYTVYRERLPHNNAMLTAKELQGFYKQPQRVGSKYYLAVHEKDVWQGLLRGSRQSSVDSLSTSINKFLISDYNYAILTANSMSMAIVKQRGLVYLFDSHSRDENGHAKDFWKVDGKACILSFKCLNAAHSYFSFWVYVDGVGKRISNHVIETIQQYQALFGVDVAENISSQELQSLYMHSITPVSIKYIPIINYLAVVCILFVCAIIYCFLDQLLALQTLTQ